MNVGRYLLLIVTMQLNKLASIFILFIDIYLYSKEQKNNFAFTGWEKDEPDKHLDNMRLESVSLAQGRFPALKTNEKGYSLSGASGDSPEVSRPGFGYIRPGQLVKF